MASRKISLHGSNFCYFQVHYHSWILGHIKSKLSGLHHLEKMVQKFLLLPKLHNPHHFDIPSQPVLHRTTLVCIATLPSNWLGLRVSLESATRRLVPVGGAQPKTIWTRGQLNSSPELHRTRPPSSSVQII